MCTGYNNLEINVLYCIKSNQPTRHAFIMYKNVVRFQVLKLNLNWKYKHTAATVLRLRPQHTLDLVFV